MNRPYRIIGLQVEPCRVQIKCPLATLPVKGSNFSRPKLQFWRVWRVTGTILAWNLIAYRPHLRVPVPVIAGDMTAERVAEIES